MTLVDCRQSIPHTNRLMAGCPLTVSEFSQYSCLRQMEAKLQPLKLSVQVAQALMWRLCLAVLLAYWQIVSQTRMVQSWSTNQGGSDTILTEYIVTQPCTKKALMNGCVLEHSTTFWYSYVGIYFGKHVGLWSWVSVKDYALIHADCFASCQLRPASAREGWGAWCVHALASLM
jgi:hypothetical protein